MGGVVSHLWTGEANPSVVELELRQGAVAAVEQARNDAEAIRAEITKLILQNQESHQKAMEAQLIAIQATATAQAQAHSEMMAMVQAQLTTIQAEAVAQSQAHSEMIAMVQAEMTANEEVKQRAVEVEEEWKRTLTVQEQTKKDAEVIVERAKKLEEAANEEKIRAIAAQEAANSLKKEAEAAAGAANEERMKATAAQEAVNMLKKEAEDEVKEANTAALAIQERVRKLEEAVSEERMKAVVANTLMKEASTTREKAEYELKEAEEEVKKANAAREEAECKVKKAEEEVKELKISIIKEKAERKLGGGNSMQPVVILTPQEFRAARIKVQYQESFFHCAIVGVAGAGKSSLINAFRGLRNRDTGSAVTGVTTTQVFGRYTSSNPQERHVWYEIPGVDTLKIPGWQYFNAQELYVFNCIIVMFDSHLTMTDIAILTNCRRFNILTRIVRSKADQHIRNIISCNMGYDSDEDEDGDQKKELYPVARQQFIEETHRIVKDNLDNANLPDQKAYIVSDGAMLGVLKGRQSKMIIDEIELRNDLFL